MKKYLYILYFLGIIICIYLIKTHKSSSIADFSPILYYAVIIVCFIAIIVTIFSQFSSGFIKNLMFGLAAGILAVILLIGGIHYFSQKRRSERIAKHVSKVETQKEFYGSLNVLKEFSVQLIKNDTNKITSITASTNLLKDTVLQNWKMKLMVFAKPDKNKTLLDYTLFESEATPIKFTTTQKVKAPLAINQYGFESISKTFGDTVTMEYVLLFTGQDPYPKGEIGLHEGFAYTSLPETEIEKRGGTLSVLQSRQYALFHSAVMLSKQELVLTNLDILSKEKGGQ